jgi:hypothetical protein
LSRGMITSLRIPLMSGNLFIRTASKPAIHATVPGVRAAEALGVTMPVSA